jgi:phage gp29-like protein
MWDRTDRWEVTALSLLRSRRLNYPTPDTWDVHVWDQGSPLRVGDTYGPNGLRLFGLKCKDYPGKFVIHAPQLSGDYPTRDGESRFVAAYMLIKRMVVRALGQDFERTVRPWVLGKYNRQEDAKKRTVAKEADIARLKEAVNALGLGSLNSAVLPDACVIEILRAASTHDPQKFLEWIDAQTTKGLLGQTYTTEPGKFGAKGASDNGRAGMKDLARYDARCICDTLERDLVYWIVFLNYGEYAARRLCPRLTLNVEEEASPEALMALAVDGTKIDMPIDIDALAERTGLPLIPREEGDKEPRRTRMVAAGKDQPVEPDAGNDPNEMSPAERAAAKKAAGAQDEDGGDDDKGGDGE